ncbi:MAG: hypothetical protein JXR10_11395 [Cyclobacteriaceae bacterium]
MSMNPKAQAKNQTITKNEMTVSWTFESDFISFEISAPTTGWVAIGFNETNDLTVTYLVMGSITADQVKIQEHYVFGPGNYRSYKTLNEPESVTGISGNHSGENTTLRFSLPTTSFYQYTKQLKPGKEYTMLMAFSQEKAFQHHSIMRTSINVKL